MSDIKSKPATNKYRDGWDRIFGKGKKKKNRIRKIDLNEIKVNYNYFKSIADDYDKAFPVYVKDVGDLLYLLGELDNEDS